jgi:hypothetical protein
MFLSKPNYTNIISYHGPVSLDLTSFIGNYIRESVNAEKMVITKIFKVYIELVQNISNYSAQVNKRLTEKNSNNGVGWFSIDEDDTVYHISSGNLISKEHGPILEKNCDQINKLNEAELRELKRFTRREASIKDVGAHIGLIHTGIISNNPLDIEISPIDEKHSFFKISVKVNKAINN